MKKLFFVVCAFFFLCMSAQATTVTIQSATISNWRFPGTTVQLRIYLRSQMVTSDSFVRLPGSPSGGAVYGQYTCTVAGNVLTIPAVTIDSTTDALVNPAATYSAFFFNSTTGAQLAAYTGFGNFAVPGSPTPTTWSALLIYNSTNVPYVDDRSYNRTQIDALIQATAGAPVASPFLTTTSAPALSGATNLGTLSTGLLKISVSGGVATPGVAVAGTDYLAVTGSGASLTNLNASNLGSGTVPDARFPSVLPALSGGNLTNLNASNLASGTVADNRLSANVTLLGSTIDVSSAEITGVLKAGSFPALTGDVMTSAGALATTLAANVVTDAKFRQSAGLSLIGRAANSTGNIADITAGSDFQILRRNGTSIAFGAIDLSQSVAVGSSVLSLANGGTGSATKNFVDLSTTQSSIAGNKSFTGITTLGPGTYFAASPSLVFSPTTLLVADSGDPVNGGSGTTSLAPTAAFETWRTGNSTTYGYVFAMRKSAGEGEIYNVFVDTLWNPNMGGFSTDVNHVNLRSDLFMLPTNNNTNRQIVGYGAWLRAGRGMPAGGAQALDVVNMRAVGAQIDVWNNSATQADFDAALINSTIALAINSEPGKHNSVGIYMQSASAASSFSVGILPSPNSVYRYGIDMSSMTHQFTGTAFTSSTNTITGTNSIFMTEAMIGDQVKLSGGTTWYTVTGINSDSSLSVTPAPGTTAPGQILIKKVTPMRLASQAFITAQGVGGNYRLAALKADDTWSFDPDGKTSSFGGDVIVYNSANATNKTTIKTFFDGASYYPGIWFGSAAPTLANYSFLADVGANKVILNATAEVELRINNSFAWGVNSNKHFVVFATDNTLDIGLSSGARPRTGYFGTSLVAPVIYGGTSPSSTLTLNATSGAPSNTAYISMNPSVSGSYPGTVFLGTSNTTSLTAAGFTDVLHLQGANATTPLVVIDSYGSVVGASLTFRHAKGTAANPTETLLGEVVANFGGRPYYTQKFDGTPQTPDFANGNRAAITFRAVENTKSDAQGMYITFETTPALSTIRAVRARISDAGNLNFAAGLGVGFGSDSAPTSGLSPATAKVVGLTDGSTAGGTFGAIATTPAQITADQNDYNPGGSSYQQRWSSNAARNITGMTFTSTQVSGQTHLILNVGSNNIVLKHESASSTAANRFFFAGAADVTIAANDGVIVTYDATTQRWRRVQ